MADSDLVAVPGLGLGAEAWRGTLGALRELGACGSSATVRLLPGYGLPTARAGAPSPAQLAAALVDGLPGSRSLTLLAHSSSCQVVAHAACLAPHVVRRLVLVGPTTDPRARSWAGLAALWLRTAAHEDARQLPLLVRQYRRTTLRSMRATMDAARRDDIAATLARVACPVVLVRGAHDRIARADWLARLTATGADRRMVQLPRGAHMVPLTHPELLASRLAPLLAADLS